MKVQDSNLTGTQGTAAPPAASGARQAALSAQSDARLGTGDNVQLSGFAGKLSATLATQASDRSAGVAALEKDYQAGRYTPDSVATSRALVTETIGLTSTGKGA